MTKPPARRPRPAALTKPKREKLLEHLRDGWTLSRSAQAVGSDRRRVWEQRQADSGFDEEIERAIAEGVDRLEDELVKAATEGWVETDEVTKGGVVVSRIVKHRRRPELLSRVREWRRPALDVSVQVTPPLAIEGRPVVGIADVIALAKSLGAAHLIGLEAGQNAEPAEEVFDAEAVELPDDDHELPPASIETAGSHVPARQLEPPAPAPMTLAEHARILREDYGR